MVALLALGFVITRVVVKNDIKVGQDEAVAIARQEIDFEPEGYNIRFLRRGIPSRPYWVVSFWVRHPRGGYSRNTVVVLEANSGRVTEVRRAT